MAQLLLAATVLAHALLVAHGNSGEFDGSGYGSGSGEPACHVPDPRPGLPGLNSRSDAILESRCHLACIEKISEREGITFEMTWMYPTWPMIPDSELERNCSINMMVQECRKGCLINKRCPQKCENKTCEPDPHACQICIRDYCQVGCDVKRELQDIDSTPNGTVPPPPRGPVSLTRTEGDEEFPTLSDAGQYYVNFTSPPPDPQQNYTHPTAIILLVSQSSRRYTYIWMTSVESVLNLSAFACQDVRTNLGVVNKYGESESNFGVNTAYSFPVYGENDSKFANHPEVQNITVFKDPRKGYWKHAVIQLTWNKPTRGYDLLDHYEIILQLDPQYYQPYCKSVEVDPCYEKVNIEIEAKSVFDGPVSGCHYIVQVKSISRNPDVHTPHAEKHEISISKHQADAVPLHFTCNQIWDDKTGNFTYKVDWSVPDDENVMRAIGSFEVIVDLVGPEDSSERIQNTSFHFDKNSSISDYHYTHEVQVEYYMDPTYSYKITMVSYPGDLAASVLIPVPRECMFGAGPAPPAQVDGIEIDIVKKDDSSKMTFDLEVVVVWTAVAIHDPAYELRIMEENTTSSDSDIDLIHSEYISEAYAELILRISPDTVRPCIFIQVRAMSQYMAVGPWSEAVCIPLPPVTSPEPEPVNTALPSHPVPGHTDNGQVVYIVVSVSVLLMLTVVILLVVIFLSYHLGLKPRKKRRPRVDKVFMTRKASDKDKYTVGTSKLDQWEVYSNQLAIQSRLGEGAFGDVYRGMFNSTITEKSNVKKFDVNNSVVVAVKLLRDNALDKDRQVFLKHVLQAKKVAQYQNAHIVCLVGCVTEQEPYSLLTEYPEQGDLLTYLRTQRHEIFQAQMQLLDYQDGVNGHKLPTIMPKFKSEQSLQAQDLMLFISHVAAGLEHLASIGVVHGDVACRNLFLTNDKVVKIADFGLDSISEEENGLVYMKSELGRLPIRWMAIESIRDGEFSTSSDVWAFGVTLWEIASLGGFPYHDTANGDILATLSAGQRLECPTNCSEEIHGIMLKCCAAVPNNRPSFSTLHQVFKSLHATSNNGQYITLDIDRTSPYYLISPRSSTSDSQTEECVLHIDPLESESESVEVEFMPHSEGGATSNQSTPATQPPSYGYGEAGFLPCITEEKEDDDEEDEKDSGNDSIYSHESRSKLTKESDREDSEDAEYD